ncbi:glycerol-3-phosphate dehydrogenase/oxidase [Paenibacillus sp. YYML68]|uniref:glycerol-3-phosphate dehydrogenase/oxidase n=1 Tax=Paenibacillus sp. YYML68 TaxID=2909250 RepID=UPI00249262CB|nr:glycerol-3-phosphate dehydrogenase/oxidase [Paenibacillus sp. YYML68]
MRRSELVEAAEGRTFDLLIIGGGITGAGIALDAASRGMSTLLLEMQDFAQGTSSRSTKLVHGGLRYLKQLDVKVVAEVGKERAIVYENGPHVTTPEWMLLPIYKGGTFGKLSTSLGLKVYDYLAGVKKNERRSMLSRQETLERAPLLKEDGLLGGGYYVEYRTDDARLTIEVMKEAANRGATALNYARVDSFLYEAGKVNGVCFTDRLSGQTHQVYARKVINAAGPWVDGLRELDGSKTGKHLLLTKGVHLVFDQSVFPLKQAVYFDTEDGRMIFAVPRDGKTYVGTTDTKYADDMISPRMTVEDRDYIMAQIRYMFPKVQVTAADIESSWSGLRPLIHAEGKSPSEISRRDEIWVSPSGLITIAGGKLTGYRKMAELVVDQVCGQLREEGYRSFPSCSTKTIPISGGHVGGSAGFAAYVEKRTKDGMTAGLTKGQAERLARRYGSNVHRVFALVLRLRQDVASSGMPLDVLAELEYSMEEEQTATPCDFFVRRTGALLFHRAWVLEHQEAVIRYMGQKLSWSEDELQKARAELEQALREAVEAL